MGTALITMPEFLEGWISLREFSHSNPEVTTLLSTSTLMCVAYVRCHVWDTDYYQTSVWYGMIQGYVVCVTLRLFCLSSV